MVSCTVRKVVTSYPGEKTAAVGKVPYVAAIYIYVLAQLTSVGAGRRLRGSVLRHHRASIRNHEHSV
jgi:hypothetical protein